MWSMTFKQYESYSIQHVCINQLAFKSRFSLYYFKLWEWKQSENPLSFDFTLSIKNKGVKYPITSILIWGTGGEGDRLSGNFLPFFEIGSLKKMIFINTNELLVVNLVPEMFDYDLYLLCLRFSKRETTSWCREWDCYY